MNAAVAKTTSMWTAALGRRLMVVSHTYAEPANREKWFAFRDVAPEYETVVITPKVWCDPDFGRMYSPPDVVDRLRFVPLKTCGQGGHYVFIAPALIGWLRRFRPDMIHVEAEPWSAVCLQLAILRRLVVPSARLSVFSWWNTPRWRTPLQFPGSRAYRLGLRATELLIAGNHDAAQLHREHGFSGSVEIVPQLGVDLVAHSPGAPEADLANHYGLGSSFVIGFVGRLHSRKGVTTLLEAAARLTDPNWKILLVGDGPQRNELAARAVALGMADRVVFSGALRRDHIPRHIRLMHVLVLPSLEEQWEQFGYVLIEAMACGVTVIGSTSGEIPWVIDDDRVVFHMGDSAALAGKLSRLMTEPGFAADCRTHGLERARDFYSNEAVARQLYAAFKSLDAPTC